jgi:KaiC/GvpD/RAD55 family RecA-like ATPase
MDESNLCAAICGKRSNYEKLSGVGLESKDFGEAARCVVSSAGEQYRRDSELSAVDRSVLRSQVERRFGQGSMADSVMDFVDSFPDDVSGINAIEEYRLLRLARTATTLATLLATGQHGDETASMVQRYTRLAAGEEGEDAKPRLTAEDFEDDEGQRIALSPTRLNNYIGGGVLRGHNITVYGRPDSGKSLFSINQAAFACRQGYRVLYVANEEPAQDITRRLLSRLAGVNIDTLRSRENLLRALDKAGKAYENWHLFHRAGCTARDIATQAAKVKPDFIIVDQLKNIAAAQDNRALQLDTLARQVRELGIEYDCVTMSVTQAGESAQNKPVLAMTDVEWSNTGIPGAADLMIGIGVNDEMLADNTRMLSIPKNKVNGRHGAFTTWINPQQTAFLSKGKV